MPRRKKQQGGYIREYYEKITSGEIIAGEWIILLYTIIIAGIDSGRWLYDDSKAQRAINFIESFCHHNKGRSDLIKLELWQKALVSTIFGIIDKDSGYRQFREVFILIARKNGKSILAAAIMAYSAFVDGEYGGELYCLAPKLDQAEIVYNDFYQIVQADDELNELTKKRRSDIYIESLNTTIKKLAFNAKKADGFNPSCTVNDEMEAWPGPQGLKQYEVMKSGTGTRNEPLTISTSTAGYVNDGIFDELFRRATAFLRGSSQEVRFLPFLYMIDDIEKWDNIDELRKASPNMGVAIPESFYIDEIKIAKGSLSKKSEFLCKYCNIKQNSSVAWLSYEDVERCQTKKADKSPVKLSLEDFKGYYCVGGIDLSKTTDLTAAAVDIEKDGIDYIFAQFWMPLERYKRAIEEEGVPYDIFLQQGFLRISGENQIQYRDVFQWFIDLVRIYKIKPLMTGYDRYSSQYLIQDMKESGFKVDDVYQGTNLTPVLHAFEGNLKDKKIEIGANNLLKAHFLNVAVDIDINDSRMKPVKIEPRAHIDGAMAVIDALTVKMKYHKEYGSQLKNLKR